MNTGPILSHNSDLEEALERLPEVVSQCLLNWRKATLDRERIESKVYMRLKAENAEKTATELKHMMNDSQERYEACLNEISFESVYTAKYETLMCKKREASLRSAF